MLKSSYKKHLKGLHSEAKVLTLYRNKGYSLVAQRLKTPYSEVDFLLRKKNKYLMVEVKSASLFSYVSDRQMKALKKSFHYFLIKYNSQVRAHLALVEDNEIHIIPDFLSD